MKHIPWYLRATFVITIALILLLSCQQDWLRNLFTTDGFDPHGDCYLWLPGLVTLHVSSDALIGLAYVAISASDTYNGKAREKRNKSSSNSGETRT